MSPRSLLSICRRRRLREVRERLRKGAERRMGSVRDTVDADIFRCVVLCCVSLKGHSPPKKKKIK